MEPSDAEELYRFYATLPVAVSKVFTPFADLTPRVIQEHLEETAAGIHISVGVLRASSIAGHGFVMNIDKAHPVFGLGLHTSVQGAGWGRRLMSEVLDRARRRGIKHMTLTVVASNTKALELYKSFGFEIAANHTFRQPNDSYLMRYDEADR